MIMIFDMDKIGNKIVTKPEADKVSQPLNSSIDIDIDIYLL